MQKQSYSNWKGRLIGDLLEMDLLKIKPNISALARKYNLNRATVKKYYESGGMPRKTKLKKNSKYDEYDKLIREKMSDSLVKISALYQYMKNRYKDKINFTYSGLKSYIERKGYRNINSNIVPHVLYETAPGEQLQCDWKEDLSIETKSGETIEFNVFSATLGYSRLHLFVFSYGKTEYDFYRCLIDVLRKIGGVPKKIKTDNMTAIVNLRDGKRRKHTSVLQFEKDLGIKINLCDVRVPETKGKVEVSNKFMDWLRPYNKEVEDVSHLTKIINTINRDCNNQINDRTHLPPALLFKEEKEYLSPLPQKILLDSYLNEINTQVVPATLLVLYKGSRYSVPQKYIGKKVYLIPQADKLYIYSNTELIVCHIITNQEINYLNSHYQEALSTRLKNKTDNVEEMSRLNLEALSKLGRLN